MEANFYPGPSKLYPQVKDWLVEAYDSGILARNHRSNAFMELLSHTIEQLKIKLAIPPDYEVYFTSSATECWEIVNQSVLDGRTSFLYNGDFGKKWFSYARLQRPDLPIQSHVFDINELPSPLPVADTICCVHTETSNGSYLPDSQLAKLRANHPSALIAVDATASMAGVKLPWQWADIWFASVQKCFGLPAGLAVMVVSPQGIERAEKVQDNRFYNSLLNIRKNFLLHQTPYTPNILGVFLLNRWATTVEHIEQIHQKTISNLLIINKLIKENSKCEWLIRNPLVQAPTVVSVAASAADVEAIKAKATQQNILLGNGYGTWKNTTFRIANFPAITEGEIRLLGEVLKNSIL